MDKYTSGAFASTKYGIYKSAQDIITSFPATVIGNGSNVSSWMIKGNMKSDLVCGDKTLNLIDNNNIEQGGWSAPAGTEPAKIENYLRCRYSNFFPVQSNTVYYDFKDLNVNMVMMDANGLSLGGSDFKTGTGSYTFLSGTVKITLIIANTDSTDPITPTYARSKNITLDYGYEIPILWGNNTYPIYISEPLRKSLDSSNLYDTIESNGTLTRRVDSSGDALVTPTTEQITVPTLTTTTSALTFDIDTTLKPSEVDLTYIGWHLYNDKKYTSGAWS